MKCIRCNRPLKEAAVKIGSFWYGPVCAEKSGLIEKKSGKCKVLVRIHNQNTPHQDGQLDFFNSQGNDE